MGMRKIGIAGIVGCGLGTRNGGFNGVRGAGYTFGIDEGGVGVLGM
jgi:hypothetical protein